MNARIHTWLKGLYVTIVTMAIYAVALGCFISLMLLVVSMEEGGSLSSLSVGLTSAILLLSQGAGFTSGSFLITLIPLLLSIMLVLLIRALALKIGTSWGGYVCGLASWVLIHIALLHTTGYTLVTSEWLNLLGIGLVFSLGYLWALLPGDDTVHSLLERAQRAMPPALYQSIRLAIRIWISLLVALAICGIATVAVWSLMNASTMGRVFDLVGMGTGSRIMTTLASVAWLPNLCIWAVSWLSGAGFTIGSSANFSLWVGQSTDLPPVPVFGLLPSALENDLLRVLCMSVPAALAFILALLAMLHPHAFHVWRRGEQQDRSLLSRKNLLRFGYPALSFCLVSILLTVSSTAVFSLSNGALGSKRLAHVGVDVANTTSMLAHSTALGLAIAWGVVLLAYGLRFGGIWFIAEIKRRADVSHSLSPDNDDRDDAGDSDGSREGKGPSGDRDGASTTSAPDDETSEASSRDAAPQRRVVSGTSGDNNGTEAFSLSNDSHPHHKEEQ
ncbi:MAG: DUF6350 family protein [Bifidobacterium psychraerophilum]|jgi:hypothetical protein|uniref:cell division protein PerM n=1 Tax=Bifidobacterium psychraerophilum TaxID=218140 RepID=UPI0039EA53A8